MNLTDAHAIQDIVESAHHIVVIQADNPDADSLGSALALEELLSTLGKQVTLYCGVAIPSYLSYVKGWDRVHDELPKQFTASIIVDASTKTLLQKLNDRGELSWIAAKPCVVIDHHETVQNAVDFATVAVIDKDAASTGSMIFELARQLSWDISASAAEGLLVSILGDTQGLTNKLAVANTYRIVADLIDAGADRSALEDRRKQQSKMSQKIFQYKSVLMQRVKFSDDGRLAHVAVPQSEINEFSAQYNPAPLIQGDMLMTDGVEIAIVFKVYDSQRITGAIRCNSGLPIANKLAESYGGGGHQYAAGFKIENVPNPYEIQEQVLNTAQQLIHQHSE